MKKLNVFGLTEMVFSMVTTVEEDQLDNVFNKNEVVKAEGTILLHTSDGKVHTITVEDLLALKIDRDSIEDVEDEK